MYIDPPRAGPFEPVTSLLTRKTVFIHSKDIIEHLEPCYKLVFTHSMGISWICRTYQGLLQMLKTHQWTKEIKNSCLHGAHLQFFWDFYFNIISDLKPPEMLQRLPKHSSPRFPQYLKRYQIWLIFSFLSLFTYSNFFLNHLRVNYILDTLLSLFQCVFPKNKDILLFYHNVIIKRNLTLIQYY